MSPCVETEPAEEITLAELDAIVEQTRSSALDEEQHRKLKVAVALLASLSVEISRKNASLKRLRKLLFGPKSEKSEKILGKPDGRGDDGGEEPVAEDTTDGDNGAESGNEPAGVPEPEKTEKPKKKRKGHGRRAASDYSGATRIHISHESLSSGDPCPDPLCAAQGGKLYRLKDPKQLLWIFGQAALGAMIYLLERLRCHLCGTIYTATPPEGVGSNKYDVTAVSMMAILRYGSGLPLNRLARLQGDLGIPLPPSTQWEVVSRAVPLFRPVYEEFIRQAAQGKVFYNDDTNMVILQFLKENQKYEELGEALERTGVFTTGIVSVKGNRRIVLFFTGRKHAGENFARVLEERQEELPPAIQMCDALSRNIPAAFETILCNCNAHARRQYVDVHDDFPEECRFVIETLGTVFKNDDIACKSGMNDEERLEFHRKESKRPMATLRGWMHKQFKERRVEPNSGLGQAIKYMQKHWRKLTRFLFVPGAPLENNAVERALKKAITHRKNSLFYKTANGARVGDMYMSLIATCQLARENPFHYLSAIQRNAVEVASDPASWMPWNYRATLERLSTPPNPSGADPPRAEKSAVASAR